MLTYRERTDPALGKPVNCSGRQTTGQGSRRTVGMLTTLPMSKSLKATPAAAKGQQGRNYPCEKEAPHGPWYQTHTFPIHAATAQKVLDNA